MNTVSIITERTVPMAGDYEVAAYGGRSGDVVHDESFDNAIDAFDYASRVSTWDGADFVLVWLDGECVAELMTKRDAIRASERAIGRA